MKRKCIPLETTSSPQGCSQLNDTTDRARLETIKCNRDRVRIVYSEQEYWKKDDEKIKDAMGKENEVSFNREKSPAIR